jgi:poly-gamma-glutamate synthesis protein (capsule biosynthesis protein)
MNCVSYRTGLTGILSPFFTEVYLGFTFSAVGDIMVHDSQLSANRDKASGRFHFHDSFRTIAPLLSETDFTFGNLETTLPGDPTMFSGYPQFGSPDELLEAISESGFDILSTANNHSADKGKTGLERTITKIQETKILPIGTYRNSEDWESRRKDHLKAAGKKIFIYQYTYGTNGMPVAEPYIVRLMTEENIRADIEFAKKNQSDCIILSFHYGSEYVLNPLRNQTDWVEFAFSEGADIVLGGHPHVLQKLEKRVQTDKYGIRKERLVFFSMGNFLSGQRKPNTDGGAVFQFAFQWIGDPDPDENSWNLMPTRIFGIRYIPTWVYPNYGHSNKKFIILPADEFHSLNFREDILPEINKMSQKDQIQRRSFYKATIQRLGVEYLATESLGRFASK